MKKLSTKEFIKKSIEVHGDWYDYGKVVYVGNRCDVIIGCPTHGDFPQRPYNHLIGRGCKKCGIESRGKIRLEKAKRKFIPAATKVHEGKYDYRKVIYTGKEDDVTIICPIHGEFTQTPSNHLAGKECRDCGIEKRSDSQRMSVADFVNRSKAIHGEKYDYSKVQYQTALKKVTLVCPDHGEFEIIPAGHLRGGGCWNCGGSMPLNDQEFINRAVAIHGQKYDYRQVIYKNNKTSVIINCPDHGAFEQTPDAHLAGKGCSRCKNKHEGRLAELLNRMSVVHRQFRIANRFFDFFLPEYGLLIERDGEQHYIESTLFDLSLSEQHNIDIEKTSLAIEAGLRIARIPYWLNEKEVELEVRNILDGHASFPSVPDLKQAKTQPKPTELIG